MTTRAPGGTLKRIVCGTPLASFDSTIDGSASRHVPSYRGGTPLASISSFMISSSSGVQKHGYALPVETRYDATLVYMASRSD